MTAGKQYGDYLCDVCSQRIGQRGRVRIVRGIVTDVFCRPHWATKTFGSWAVRR